MGPVKPARLFIVVLLASLAGCASSPPPHQTPPSQRAGSEGPPGYPRAGNPPFYDQFGQRYYVMATAAGYRERGVASWYGAKFHGRPTASGEIYDMHKLTAAHKTLPLPSWATVRNLKNGREVIVRINDRGPFVDNRLIDLSYAAARELDLITAGTGLVEVRVIDGPRSSGSAPPPAPVPAQTATTREIPAAAHPAAPAPTAAAPVDDPLIAVAMPHDVPRVEEVAAQLLIDETLAVPATGGDVFVQLGAFGSQLNAMSLRQRLAGYGFTRAHISPTDGEPPLFRVRIGPLSSTEEYDRVVEQMARFDIKDSYLTVE